MSSSASTGASSPATPSRPDGSSLVSPAPLSLGSPAASSVVSNDPLTPSTPTFPSAARSPISSQRSFSSVRRKPVPRTLDDIESSSTYAPSSFSFTEPSARASLDSLPTLQQPPTYVLPVDPPSYPSTSSVRAQTPLSPAAGASIDIPSSEDLPRYAAEGETEPQTLARALWRWGWLCPLLWAIGMTILWVPLRPTEEETDAEKAQKLEEMIVILRRTELKYARRCLRGFIGFLCLLVAVVGLAVVLTQVL